MDYTALILIIIIGIVATDLGSILHLYHI